MTIVDSQDQKNFDSPIVQERVELKLPVHSLASEAALTLNLDSAFFRSSPELPAAALPQQSEQLFRLGEGTEANLELCKAIAAMGSPYEVTESTVLQVDGECAYLGAANRANTLFFNEALREAFCQLYSGREIKVHFAYGVQHEGIFKGETHTFLAKVRSAPIELVSKSHPWLSVVEFLDSAELPSPPHQRISTFLQSDTVQFRTLPQTRRVPDNEFAGFVNDITNDLSTQQWQSTLDRSCNQLEELRAFFKQHAGNVDALRSVGEAQNAYFESPLTGQPAELPSELTLRALTLRQVYAAFLNHTVRLQSQIWLEQRGYIPVETKHIEAIESRSDNALDYSEFSRGVAPTAAEVGSDKDERTKRFLAEGSFSFVNDKFTANYLNGSSMTEWSALGTATMGLVGSISYFPLDGMWHDPKVRLAYAQRVAHLINNDPILDCDLFDDPTVLIGNLSKREYLVQRAFRNLGPTVKPFDKQAVEEVKRMYDLGFRSVRIYDPRATTGMRGSLQLIDQLRKEHELDDMVISVGMVVDAAEAIRLRESGANSLIVGIGGGSICDTPTAADINAQNMQTVYSLNKAGVGLPIMAEGGVGPKFGVLMAVGGAGNQATGKIVGGTIEQTPVLFWQLTPDGKSQAKDYKGEASPAIKRQGGNTDAAGYATNVEGVIGFEPYVHSNPTVPMRLWKYMEGLAKAELMQRETTIERLTHQITPDLYHIGEGAQKNMSTHGPGARKGNSKSVAEYNRRAKLEMIKSWGIGDPSISSKVRHPPLEDVF